MIFDYDTLQKFNKTEIKIYQYITGNLQAIEFMSVRDLARKTDVSASTILRFCNKLGFDGYKDFKDALMEEQKAGEKFRPDDDLKSLAAFFDMANSSMFEEKLQEAARMIEKSDGVIFLGGGSSEILAHYMARIFMDRGIFSVTSDIGTRTDAIRFESASVVVLSESGETPEIIPMIEDFRSKGYDILSITNSPDSTVARISDWNLNYNLKHLRIEGRNATSQVPVLFIGEALARRIDVPEH